MKQQKVTTSSDHQAVEQVLLNTLAIISGPAGERDFKAFNSQFTADASIGVSQQGKYFSFTPAQYEERNGPYFMQNDFFEEQKAAKITIWKNIAEAKQVYYLYNGDPETTPVDKKGVNFYRLVKIGGEWKIQSIVFSTFEDGEALPF